jgi:dynein heavy chain, axonemal
MDSPDSQIKARQEIERKARRGDGVDPRLEYAFQLLIDCTGLTRHEVMDFIFEDNMVNGML